MNLLNTPIRQIAVSTYSAFPVSKNCSIIKAPLSFSRYFQIAIIITTDFLFGKIREPRIVRQILGKFDYQVHVNLR